ncbi:hypothetical protein MBLNU13_g06601t1 [Cladosporium sp. NU13]
MRFTVLLTTALLPLSALSSPVAIPIASPGEIVPGTSGNVPGTATWYCLFTYEILFEHFTIEAHKWGVSEQELKELIPGPITAWNFQRIGEGWSDFLVNFALPIGYHGKVEKSLNQFVRDDADFKCHLIDQTQGRV